MHEVLDRKRVQVQDLASAEDPQKKAPLVTMQHLRMALQVARSSLPASERRRLEAIYERFTQQRDPSVGNRQPEGEGRGSWGSKRSTLA